LKWLTWQDFLGVQLFCAMLWKFWAGRNVAVFKGIQLDPTHLGMHAVNFIYDFNEANPPRAIRTPLRQSVNLHSTSPTSFSIFVDVGHCVAGSTIWG
jgi:hypothetical protein